MEQAPVVLAPTMSSAPFACGKLQSKNKLYQRYEKYGNKGTHQRRLNNNNVVTEHSQGLSVLSQGL